MLRASFIYHQITAMFSIISTIVLIYSLFYYKHNKINSFQLAIITLILSISWGIHAIIHFLEEYIYDFEPISGNTKVLLKPIRV